MSSGPATLPSPRRADINLRNVSFTYPGSSETGLARYLIAHPGETIAMIGENGAGKTTLVKLLARLYDPDTGAIEFDGADLRTLSLDDLHKQIGFVFQDFNRFEATAAVSPMAIGGLCPATGKGSKKSGVWRGGDHGAIDAGYDTVLGRVFGEHDLSRGQWQKLAIARAFAQNASLLILDEPSASLSVQAEYELFCRFHRAHTEGHAWRCIAGKPPPSPQLDRSFAVVHNGLISNYEDLKSELEKRGNHFFFSQTDTEVIVYLMEEAYQDGSVEEAFLKVLRRLEGTFAVAMISIGEHQKIFCASLESPLILGINSRPKFVSSNVEVFSP